MVRIDMHHIKRNPQAPGGVLTDRITFTQNTNTGLPASSFIATDSAAQSVLTSLVQTVVETISQPATTVVTTRTQTIAITDSAQFSSIQASESSQGAGQSTTSAAKTSSDSATQSTSTASSSNSSSSNLSTLIPAIVVPIAAVLVISFVIFWFVMRRRHKRQLKKEPEFVMAKKPEKPVSRGHSNSSSHSSTRELVPLSKLEKEKEIAVTTSEVKQSSNDMTPPKYSSTDIGLARPMTPPDKSNPSVNKEKSFPNFSSPRPTTANRSRLSQDQSNVSRKVNNIATQDKSMPPPRSTGRNSSPSSGRGAPMSTTRGPQSQPNRLPGPGGQNMRTEAGSPARGGPTPLRTMMNAGNRAAPPQALNPPTPTGAFNGASSISQYSPIVKDQFSLGAMALSSSTDGPGQAPLSVSTKNMPPSRSTDSPIDDAALSKENMRIARFANSSRLGFSNSPVESNFPTRGTNNAKGLSPLSEGPNKAESGATSPRLPPPLSREDMLSKPFAHVLDSPAPGSSIYPSPSIGAGATPYLGGNPSTTSLLHNEQRSVAAGTPNNAHPRESVISRVSSDDEYVDMDIDAKSDVSSLDEREKWELEDERQAMSSRPDTSHNGSGYEAVSMSPTDGPAGVSSAGTGTTKPSLRDRDSEGPFVLSRY